VWRASAQTLRDERDAAVASVYLALAAWLRGCGSDTAPELVIPPPPAADTPRVRLFSLSDAASPEHRLSPLVATQCWSCPRAPPTP
jgi:hypothetical protein